MAPTESAILTRFLLPPAPLQSILSLQQFTDLFPRTQRSNPQIARLYRELQYLRALDVDEVKRNIAQESTRGERLRREFGKARQRAEREEMEGIDIRDIGMEADVVPSSRSLDSKPHKLSTILIELEQACSDLDAEIAANKMDMAAILQDLEITIGDLSDLRYGRFSEPVGVQKGFVKDTIKSLRDLERICRSEPGN